MAGGISRRQFGAAAGAALTAAVAACGSHDSRGSRDSKPATPPIPAASSLGYTVNVDAPGGGRGYVFYVSGTTAANPGGTGSKAAVLVIADKSGRVVWQRELPAGQTAGNLRVQTYQGRPVLTWWQGLKQGGHGLGQSYIADERYNVIDTVTPGGELSSDIHEFRLTPDGHALITSYQEVVTDLSAVGGPKDGRIYNCIASVVDVARHQTLFQWDALAHVPVSESPAKYTAGQVFDPYHMNSIALDPAGNLLISMRALSTVFNVDPRSGAINWRLGGKQSTFALGEGVEFAYQHDVEMPDENTITLFDNHFEGNAGQTSGGSVPSSLKWIRLDRAARTTSLLRAQPHPDKLSSGAMGNLQQLPGGGTFSGWGTAGRIAEFAADGTMLYDVALAGGTYRAYLNEWTGNPVEPPRMIFAGDTVHAVWNGATAVRSWRLRHGPQSTAMTALAGADWAGYDTALPLNGSTAGYYQLQALDAAGKVIGETPPLPHTG
ncbi:arylsulfotransferase family protein [Mycobacterium sp. TY814]|uniref:arylsulfotransferase family protein n=1 Tax=unclassified Mycobacterium TaxID=2642494 RepID=UPI0027416ED7|nr:arylsulfotransferase family protein [Mycobacterium sp. TY814]MDP7725993.1 arylsulfotransferase family protein [Mycobacterium sp. TY814]